MAARKMRKTAAEDLYKFELITDLDLSPNGKQIVYSLQRIERKTQKKFSNLWIVPTGRGRPRQFTYGNQSDVHPRWSPDGKSIAFLSNRTDAKQMQICIIPFDGGEARTVTSLKGAIQGFEFSPNGKKFVTTFRKIDPEVAAREKDAEAKKLGTVARRYNRVFFKEDGSGFNPAERVHIWTIDTRSGKATQLTDSKIHDEWAPIWSPDGKHILFTSNRADDPDINMYEIDFYIIPTGGGRLRKLNTPIGNKMAASFSPDGKWIAWYGNEGSGRWWRDTEIWLTPARGGGKSRSLTAGTGIDVGSSTINDVIGALGMVRPTWSPDGKHIYFQQGIHGSNRLMKISVTDSKPVAEDIIAGQGVVGKFAFDKTHDKLVYYFGDMFTPGNIIARDMRSDTTRTLTRVNNRMLDGINLGDVEEVWFKGGSGNKVQGWIMKPPGFSAKRKYAAIIEIHGGPLAQYGNLFMHEFFYLAAHGYIVAFCNPRGGRGYGEKHAKAIHNNWGGPDYADMMKFTDLVARRKYVDSKRMGVTGGSYGGYMTNWIIGHTHRFKAAVTQRSVSNLISFWGESDFNWAFQEIFGDQPPWENINNYWKQSPMKYIGNAKTPTMVIHSEADHRCPIGQGEQVFVALKRLGVDTELVRFPDEPHGLSRGGRTDRRIKRLECILGWFKKYLR